MQQAQMEQQKRNNIYSLAADLFKSVYSGFAPKDLPEVAKKAITAAKIFHEEVYRDIEQEQGKEHHGGGKIQSGR